MKAVEIDKRCSPFASAKGKFIDRWGLWFPDDQRKLLRTLFEEDHQVRNFEAPVLNGHPKRIFIVVSPTRHKDTMTSAKNGRMREIQATWHLKPVANLTRIRLGYYVRQENQLNIPELTEFEREGFSTGKELYSFTLAHIFDVLESKPDDQRFVQVNFVRNGMPCVAFLNLTFSKPGARILGVEYSAMQDDGTMSSETLALPEVPATPA